MLVKRGYRVTSISYKWRTGDVVKLAAIHCIPRSSAARTTVGCAWTERALPA
jgi:hypothetical protein